MASMDPQPRKLPGEEGSAVPAVDLGEVRAAKSIGEAADLLPGMGAADLIGLADRLGMDGAKRIRWIRQACEEGRSDWLGAMRAGGWLGEGSKFDPSKDGGECLRMAVQVASVECVRILLESGVQVDERGRGGASGVTALMSAALGADPEMVEFLLEAGADIEARSPSGKTALGLVASTGGTAMRREVREMLIHAGADWWSPGRDGEPSVLGALWLGERDRAGALGLIRGWAKALDSEAWAHVMALTREAAMREPDEVALACAEAFSKFEASQMGAVAWDPLGPRRKRSLSL